MSLEWIIKSCDADRPDMWLRERLTLHDALIGYQTKHAVLEEGEKEKAAH